MDTHATPENEPAPSIRESLAAAVSEVESAADAAAPDALPADGNQTPEENAPSDDRPRDDQGRFARKIEDAPADEKAALAAPKPDAQKANPPSADEQTRTAADEPPSSWNAQGRELYAKADPKLREYIRQRESEQRQGVEKLKADLEPRAKWAEDMWGVIAPYDQMIKAEGGTPAAAVKDLLGMAALMRTGSPEQKRDLLIKTAQQFGVDLSGQIPQQQQDPAYAALQRELSGVKQTLTGWQQQQAETRQRELTSQIDAFKADKPHFDKVRGVMGQLLKAGTATDLQDAYDKAVRLDSDLWAETQAEQKAKAEADQRAKAAEEVERKKRAAGSVTGAPGLAGSGQSPAPVKDVRAELERNFAAALRA